MSEWSSNLPAPSLCRRCHRYFRDRRKTTDSSGLPVCAAVIGGYLSDKFHRGLLVGIGTTISGATFVVMAFTSSFTVVLAVNVVSGLVGGLFQAARNALIADSLPDSANAARDYTMIHVMSYNVPGLFVPLVCGALLDAFSSKQLAYRVFWLVSAAFTLLSVPLLLRVKPRAAAAHVAAARAD